MEIFYLVGTRKKSHGFLLFGILQANTKASKISREKTENACFQIFERICQNRIFFLIFYALKRQAAGQPE